MVLTGPPHPVSPLQWWGEKPLGSQLSFGGSGPCPIFPQEFEIELEGSQSLRILCYEKCYDKTKVNKDNNEIVDKIMGKGQIQVRGRYSQGTRARLRELSGGGASGEGVLLLHLLGQGDEPFVTWVQSCSEKRSPRWLFSPAGDGVLF